MLWLANYDGSFYGLREESGETVRHYRAENAFEFPPLLGGNRLFFSGIDRQIYRLEPGRDRVEVVGKLPLAVSAPLTIWQGHLVAGLYDGRLLAVSLTDSSRRELYRFSDRVIQLFTDGRFLWASSRDRRLLCFGDEVLQSE